MVLLRFLIISICVMYIIRSLVRIFLPMLFQNMMNKAQQQHNYSQQQYRQQRPQQPDNKVKIDHVPPAKKNSVPDSEGDFIDYEEVK